VLSTEAAHASADTRAQPCQRLRYTLTGLIRQPQSRRDLYRLDQLSFVRLWHTALVWDGVQEKQRLLQLVAAACRKAHSVDLRMS
jgi:hypothetical protein